MTNNPLNLALRFILEVAGLIALGAWGWQTGSGGLRYILAIGIPLAAAAIWGIFRVPNDPAKAPVAVPGWVRLGIEVIYFTFASWALYDLGAITLSLIFVSVTILHYLISYDRVYRLLKTNT